MRESKARILVPAGSIYRVSGPMTIIVEEGRVLLGGWVYKSGDKISISSYRSYAFKALEQSVVSLILMPGSSIEKPVPEEEPLEKWIEVADNIISSCDHEDSGKPCIVYVTGPTDSGKTSFCSFLANRAIAKNKSVAIIDADVGQSDIGPPGFISIAFPEKPFLWMRELWAEELVLVGSITPSPVVGRIITGIKRLLETARSKNIDLVIIDSDGWVSGMQALEYRIDVVRSIDPSYIVVVGDDVLHASLSKIIGMNNKIVFIESPKRVITRNRTDRRFLRRESYKKYFEDAKELEISINDIVVIGSCLFSGINITNSLSNTLSNNMQCKILYASQLPGSICLLVSEDCELSRTDLQGLANTMNVGEVLVIRKGDEKGVIASVLDDKMREVAPAIIESLDVENMVLKIRTCYKGVVKGIVVSKLKITRDFEEAGKPTRYLI